MKIYQQEIMDGVSDAVLSSNSIACVSEASLIDKSSTDIDDLLHKIKADANPEQIDLHYLKSVLVSTGWNKNDDVFTSQATWEARNTPEDKQFNFMHNENDIIGHITGSYVVDKDGNQIDSEEAPSEFDIITEAVLYNSWTDPENRQRMEQIIAEIKEGKWFVSMECLFAGFDYALVGDDGSSKVLARSEDTSFLTKHLRASGGEGTYQGYKVGRSLRQISFSGKGLVAKPANPRSVILDTSKAYSNDSDNLKPSIKGEVNMSDVNVLEKQIADLKSELVSAKEENVALQASLDDATSKEHTEAIAKLESDIATQAEAMKTLEESIAAKDATIAELQAAAETAEADMKEKMEELRKMKKKEADMKRKASLIEIGYDDESADEAVASYADFDDAAFEAILAAVKDVEEMKKKKADMHGDKEKKKEEAAPKGQKPVKAEEAEEAEAEEVTEELFDGVDSTEATLVDASDDTDELEATRASVAEWLENNVLRK